MACYLIVNFYSVRIAIPMGIIQWSKRLQLVGTPTADKIIATIVVRMRTIKDSVQKFEKLVLT